MAKSDNETREQQILDAAADLFVHYGYDKTTVDDIARQAGISKGAIYLHFKSKDALFEELLIRELLTFGQGWLTHLEADPKGGTLAGMYKNMLYALNDSPFMAALFKRDRRVFGSYLRKPGSFFRKLQEGQSPGPRYEFVKMMQDAGAMRQDLDPKVIAHIMNILAYGLVAMDEVMPAEQIPPIEEVIEGIADMMERALTPPEGGNSEVGKTIVRQLAEAGLQQYAQMRSQKKESNSHD